MTVFRNELYFVARDALNGSELYKYDGESVSVVANIRSGAASSFPWDPVVFDGQIFFHADDGTGRKLFRYDGDSVVPVWPNLDAAGILIPNESIDLTVFNGELYFRAGVLGRGVELVKVSRIPEPSGFTLVAFAAASCILRSARWWYLRSKRATSVVAN
jgi:ELWxxDGT repeat protein